MTFDPAFSFFFSFNVPWYIVDCHMVFYQVTHLEGGEKTTRAAAEGEEEEKRVGRSTATV